MFPENVIFQKFQNKKTKIFRNSRGIQRNLGAFYIQEKSAKREFLKRIFLEKSKLLKCSDSKNKEKILDFGLYRRSTLYVLVTFYSRATNLGALLYSLFWIFFHGFEKFAIFLQWEISKKDLQKKVTQYIMMFLL